MAINNIGLDQGFTQGVRTKGTVAGASPAFIKPQPVQKIRVSADGNYPAWDTARIADRFRLAAGGNAELEKALTDNGFIEWFGKNRGGHGYDSLKDYDITSAYKLYLQSPAGQRYSAWRDFTQNFGNRAASFQ